MSADGGCIVLIESIEAKAALRAGMTMSSLSPTVRAMLAAFSSE